jgi:hypothetical protein
MADHPLDVLERRLQDAARRQVAAAPRRSRRFVFFAALLATFTLGGAAFAVTSLLPSGSPVAYRLGPPAPGKGLGTPITGTVRMLTDTVADPDGGLPWGLRSFATSRGYTCLQVGRVQHGELGFIGRTDRRFHVLRPGVVVDQRQCVGNDGAGHGFLALHFGALPAGGDGASCDPVRVRPNIPRCRASELRAVDAGLLGPAATGMTLRGGGQSALLGPDRGYLVVGRGKAPRVRTLGKARAVESEDRASLTPSSPVIAGVDYGDTHCTVTADIATRGGSCGIPDGLVAIPQPEPAAVRARVTARVVRPGTIRVRFRAPVAIVDSRSTYNVLVRPPSCGAGRGVKSVNVEHNVAAGELVGVDFTHFCRRTGRFRVEVRYQTTPAYPRPGVQALARPGMTVGRTAVRSRG